MALDQKFFKKSTVATGLADQEEALSLYLDANDVDSYDGDGSIWYDIAGHEVNIPLADKASNLQLHLNASNLTSYSGSGTTWTDISGNSRHGTITDPVFEGGLKGGLDFNSATSTSGDKVVVAHNAAFNQQNNMTFEIWLKRDSTSEDNIFHKGNSSGNSYFLNWNPSYGYYFYTYVWAGGVYSGTSGLSTGVYEHVVVTIDGSGNRKMYVNGTLSANNLNGNTTGTGSLTDTGPLTIGGYYTYAQNGGFDGKISIVRIYDTVLTAAEIGQNYRAGNFINYSSIITSKHEATQGTLYSTNLALSLNANGYTSGAWSNTVNSSYNATVNGAVHYNDNNSDYFDFDGSDDYAEVAAYAGTDIGSGGFTFEAWALCEASSGTDTIVSNIGSNLHGYQLLANGTNVKLYVYAGSDPPLANVQASSSIVVGTWNHYSFTVSSASSGAAVKLYINGSEAATGSLSSAYSGANTSFNIGKYPYAPSTRYFEGKIAQVRTYSAALTLAQINTNYNATKALYLNPTMEMNLLGSAYTSGATWSDSSGKGNNGSISGTPNYDQELGDYLNFSPGQASGGGASGTSDVSTTRLTVSSFSALQTATAFTIELWLKSSTASSDGMIWNVFDSSSSTRKFSLSWNNGNFRWVVYSASGGYNASQDLFSTNTFSTNTWYHVVATYNYNTEMKIYVDGVLEGAETSPNLGVNTTTTTQMRIGDRSDGYAVDTQVGQARFYTGALTQAQIAQNYLATKNKYPNGINFTGSNISWNANGYFSFNGSNAKFGTSGAPSALINATGFTVSAWLWRTNNATGSNTIVGQCHDNGNSGQNWILTVSGSGTVYFHIYGNDDYSGVSNLVSYETWTHLAGVVEDDGVKRIYKNGVVQLSTAAGKSADTVSYNTFVGNLGAINWHDGRIGAVKYYKKPLTADELLADFNATKATYGL